MVWCWNYIAMKLEKPCLCRGTQGTGEGDAHWVATPMFQAFVHMHSYIWHSVLAGALQ